MFRLYKIYHNGINVEKDDKEALEWLEAAAEQGHQEAKSTYQGIKMAIRNRLDDGALERGVIIWV